MEVTRTDNGAWVYQVGVSGPRHALIPIAKTFPQRRIEAEQSEIITISIEGISRKKGQNGWRYSLIKPQAVKTPSPAAKPDDISRVERLYEEAKEVK